MEERGRDGKKLYLIPDLCLPVRLPVRGGCSKYVLCNIFEGLLGCGALPVQSALCRVVLAKAAKRLVEHVLVVHLINVRDRHTDRDAVARRALIATYGDRLILVRLNARIQHRIRLLLTRLKAEARLPYEPIGEQVGQVLIQ